MPEYATPTNTSNPLLNPGFIWRITAFVLLAVALLGIVMNAVNSNANGVSTGLGFGNTLFNFTWTHNILHVILAVAAFVFGFSSLPGNVVKTFAIIFGVVYFALGITGFFAFTAPSDTLLALTPGLNVVHLVLGALYLVSSLSARYT